MKQAYNKAVIRYVKAFEKKQNLNFECWVANEVGTIGEFSGGMYYIDFQDIKIDIDNNIKAGKFIEYYDLCMGNRYKKINYKTFNMKYK